MSLYNNIFDAHAHYDDKWFDDDRFELLENIHTKGVCGIVNNAVDLETAKTCIEYAEKYDFMYAAVGFHPENLENIPDNYLEQLAQLSKHKKVVAIGETGLDYHWDIPKDLQKRVFEEQIRLSLDLEMPLIVHDREAHGDVYDLLRKYKPNALIHCFSVVRVWPSSGMNFRMSRLNSWVIKSTLQKRRKSPLMLSLSL